MHTHSIAEPVAPSAERGAVTLWLVLGLVLVATLAAAWGARTVLMSALTSQSLGQRVQARYAAQAALASGQAELLQAFAQNPARDPFAAATVAACPSGLTGPRWQCVGLPLGLGPTLGSAGTWLLETLLVRDLLSAPHVWQLHASARHHMGNGQAQVRESLWVPVLAPIPQDGLATAPSGVLQLPSDASPNNPTVAAASNTSPCSGTIWRSLLGNNTPAQLQAWSQAQERNGLHSLSQPQRSVYWVDSPADWTQSLGSASAPVLLVFSRQACALRCPRIAGGVQIHGTVFVDAACDADKLRGWTSGSIHGLLAIEGTLPSNSPALAVRTQAYARQAFALAWPENAGADAGTRADAGAGPEAARVQRVPGSQRAGTP